jgi:Raf kinase inhibitor-like YbhB/YbcL family protein
MQRMMSFLLLAVLAGGTLSAQTFTVKSNELGGQATNRQDGNVFGWHGENASPELHWENVPAGTQSFAVTIYDKDAPTGSGFWHWIIYNIPADIMELPSDAGNLARNLAPAGSTQGNNDGGMPGYLGPCPPPGPIHEYLITVYALKTKLSLDKNASPALTGFYLNANVIGKASLVMYAQNKN